MEVKNYNRTKAHKASCKKWRSKNAVHIRQYVEQYAEKNLVKLREQAKIRMRKYYKKKSQEIDYRLNQALKANLNQCIRKDKDGRRWEIILGYNLQSLKTHLEKLFKPGMTWENYGKWHIDHIKPKSSFSFNNTNSSEFRECWNLNNLQPLWSADNIRKSNKVA